MYILVMWQTVFYLGTIHMHMRDSIASYFRYICMHFINIWTIGNICYTSANKPVRKKKAKKKSICKAINTKHSQALHIYLITTQTYLCNVEWIHFFCKIWRVVIHIQDADCYISYVAMHSVSDFYLSKYQFSMLMH